MKSIHATVFLLAAFTGMATCLFWRNHYYIQFNLTWTDAQAFCRMNFVDLSTVDQAPEYTLFKPYTTRGWIGLSKKPYATDFTEWSDGSLFRLSGWGSGDPECCVSIVDGVFSTFSCMQELHFFCYIWYPQVITVQEKKTWQEALEYCRTQYTDLISLNTEVDLFVAKNASRNIQTSSFWIGLRFLDGSWFWVNRSYLGRLVSLPSCPAHPFQCGAQKAGAGVLEDRDCEEKLNFMCYKV